MACLCVCVSESVYKLICLKLLVSLSLEGNFKAIWQAQKLFVHSASGLKESRRVLRLLRPNPFFRGGCPTLYIYTEFYVLLTHCTLAEIITQF